jgi:hypothetical protein
VDRNEQGEEGIPMKRLKIWRGWRQESEKQAVSLIVVDCH